MLKHKYSKSKGSISEDIEDDVVDEVGDVGMPMGETGYKFNILSEEEYDSVIIKNK